MLTLHDYGFEQLAIGQTASFERAITEEDVKAFARLSGDWNPLHTDERYAAGTRFNGRIAHGMLIAGLFSALLGMLCPGKRMLYLSQTLTFRRPVPLGATVLVRCTIIAKAPSVRTVTLRTEALLEGAIAVDGEAVAQLLG